MISCFLQDGTMQKSCSWSKPKEDKKCDQYKSGKSRCLCIGDRCNAGLTNYWSGQDE